jgi:general secretion pathway protein K
MKLAMNANRQTDLIWLGRSGVERARWILAQQMSCPYDDNKQKWAGGPGGDCDTNGPLAEISLDNFQVGDGTISIRIRDLERKININMATDKILTDALTLAGVDSSEVTPITSSVLDWIDPDEVTHVNGAESDYYQKYDPPYYAKNKPLDDLSELLLIKGIRDNPDVYWGPTSTNHDPAAFMRVDRFGRAIRPPIYTLGMADVFTPLSSGQVNIYTASRNVIAILLGGDETAADAIVQLRDASDSGPIRVEDLLRSAGINNQGVSAAARFFNQRSATFEVEVDARIGDYGRTFYATLRRNSPRDVQILTFHWD